jgi:hypothetical protein
VKIIVYAATHRKNYDNRKICKDLFGHDVQLQHTDFSRKNSRAWGTYVGGIFVLHKTLGPRARTGKTKLAKAKPDMMCSFSW